MRSPEFVLPPPDAPGAGIPGAQVALLPPPPDLAPAVEYMWQLVLPAITDEPTAWRVVVDGYIDVSLRLPLTPETVRAVHEGGTRLGVPLDAGRAVVCGAATTARLLPMTVPLLLTGARFRLGAAAEVLRTPPNELVNGARSLHELLDGAAVRDVARALSGGGGATLDAAPGDTVDPLVAAVAMECVHAIVRRLMRRATARQAARTGPDPRVRAALALLDDREAPLQREARAYAGTPDASDALVSLLARRLNVSVRTLERSFATHIGFAPRQYRRLRRVGAVAEALERPTAAHAGRTLSDLAHHLGYADHAHMTREFTRMMGVAPSEYRREVLAIPTRWEERGVAFDRSVPLGTVTRLPRPAAPLPPSRPHLPRGSGIYAPIPWPEAAAG